MIKHVPIQECTTINKTHNGRFPKLLHSEARNKELKQEILNNRTKIKKLEFDLSTAIYAGKKFHQQWRQLFQLNYKEKISKSERKV